MNCPACRRPLSSLDAGSVVVQACTAGCGGVWLDAADAKRAEDPLEAIAPAVLLLRDHPGLTVDLEQRRICPTCAPVVMMRHFASGKRQVTIDECPTCGGVWLDAGELKRIREEYPTADARRRAALQAGEVSMVDDRLALDRIEIDQALPLTTGTSRWLSAGLTVIYLSAAGTVSPVLALRLFVYCIVPLCCIWFPDAMGSPIGMFRLVRPSHRRFVWFFGWLVLLLPIVALAIVWLNPLP